MHVTHGTVNGSRRDFQRRDDLGGLDESCRAWQNSRIIRALDEHRRVAGLQFHAHLDEHVRLAQFLDETGLGLRKVRIFRALQQHCYRDLIAANPLYQVAQVRYGCYHFEGLTVLRADVRGADVGR